MIRHLLIWLRRGEAGTEGVASHKTKVNLFAKCPPDNKLPVTDKLDLLAYGRYRNSALLTAPVPIAKPTNGTGIALSQKYFITHYLEKKEIGSEFHLMEKYCVGTFAVFLLCCIAWNVTALMTEIPHPSKLPYAIINGEAPL